MVSSIENQLELSQAASHLATWHKHMERDGLTLNDLQRAIDDPVLRRGLIKYWQSGNFDPQLEWKTAKDFRDWHELNPCQVTGRLATWYQRVVENGLTLGDLIKASASSDIRKCLIRYWHIESLKASPSQKKAQEIMGKNMISVARAVECFELNPTHEQLLALGQIPFTEDLLKRCRNTHILVPVFPFSVKTIADLVGKKMFYHEATWKDNLPYFTEKGVPEWQLIRKTLYPKSKDLGRDQQFALISDVEEVPSARVITYAIFLYYLATGERLFRKKLGRTSTPHFRQEWTYVICGIFNESCGYWFDEPYDWLNFTWDYLGIFSAMKKNC